MISCNARQDTASFHQKRGRSFLPPKATPRDWTPRQITAADNTVLTFAVTSHTTPSKASVSAARAA